MPAAFDPKLILPDSRSMILYGQSGRGVYTSGEAKPWDTDSKAVRLVPASEGIEFAMTPDGERQVRYNCATGELTVLDRESRVIKHFLTRRPKNDENLALRLSNDGTLLAWTACKGQGHKDAIAVWDLSRGQLIHESDHFDDTGDPVPCVRPSDVRWPIRMVTSSSCHKFAVWGFDGTEQRLLAKCLPDGIYDGNGRVLSRLGGDPEATPPTFAAERVPVTYLMGAQGEFPDHAVRCYVSPDGRWAFIGGRYKWNRGEINQWLADNLTFLDWPKEFAELRLMDLDNLTVGASISGVDDVRFARDGSFMVANDGDGPIRVYDLPPRFSRAEPAVASLVLALLAIASIYQFIPRKRTA